MSKYNFVPREKYDHIKSKSTQWYDECSELHIRIEKLTQMNKDLIVQNEDLLDQISDLNNSTTHETNNEMIIELENDNKNLMKELRKLKRDNKLDYEKHRDKISQLERDLFIKDGTIQRLEDSKKDLNERFLELKEDWREERRNKKDK